MSNFCPMRYPQTLDFWCAGLRYHSDWRHVFCTQSHHLANCTFLSVMIKTVTAHQSAFVLWSPSVQQEIFQPVCATLSTPALLRRQVSRSGASEELLDPILSVRPASWLPSAGAGDNSKLLLDHKLSLPVKESGVSPERAFERPVVSYFLDSSSAAVDSTLDASVVTSSKLTHR